MASTTESPDDNSSLPKMCELQAEHCKGKDPCDVNLDDGSIKRQSNDFGSHIDLAMGPPCDRQSPSSMIDPNGLSQPGNGTLSRINETPSQTEERLEKMCGAVKTLLECVGEDPSREGLLATPARYAKALLFLTSGYHGNIHEVVNNALFNEGHGEMVIVKDIEFHSLCEHHLLPFTGSLHIGYMPSDAVIGLSKLPRIVEMFSRRLQIQERLTTEVAHTVMEILKPKGVVVVVESSHLCMAMRGVEKTGTTTVTSCALGCFEEEETLKKFFNLIGVSRMSLRP